MRQRLVQCLPFLTKEQSLSIRFARTWTCREFPSTLVVTELNHPHFSYCSYSFSTSCYFPVALRAIYPSSEEQERDFQNLKKWKELVTFRRMSTDRWGSIQKTKNRAKRWPGLEGNLKRTLLLSVHEHGQLPGREGKESHGNPKLNPSCR